MPTLANYGATGFIDVATSADPSTSLFAPGQATVTLATIRCEFNKWKKVALTVSCPNPLWYSQNVLPIRLNNTPVYFRVGMVVGGSAVYTPWEKHVIVAANQDPPSPLPGTLPTVQIVTSDLLCSLDIADRVIVRKGSISDIVSSIASAANLQATVEPTNTDQLTLYQLYQTDYSFIRDRLLPRALNQSGYGDYKFYISNGTLYFSTLDYQAGQPLDIYYSSQLGQPVVVYNVRPSDALWERMMEGSAGVAATVGNAYQSGKVAITSNDNGSTLAYGTASVNPTPAADFQKLIGRHKGDNPVSEIQAQAQNHYSSKRNEQYGISFCVDGNPFVNLGSLINMIFNQTYDYSGLYSIAKSIHQYAGGAFTSTYVAIRDSSQSISASSPTLQTGTSTASQPFGSTPSTTVGTAPRVNQTSVLSAASAGPTVSVPVQSAS